MSETVLNNDIKRTIWERQSGMCALTGKKFDEFNESIEANFIFVNPDEANPDDLNNIVMVWKSQELPKGKLHKYHFPYANFHGSPCRRYSPQNPRIHLYPRNTPFHICGLRHS